MQLLASSDGQTSNLLEKALVKLMPEIYELLRLGLRLEGFKLLSVYMS